MKRICPPHEIGTKHRACNERGAQSFAGAKMPNVQEFRKRAEECHRLAAAVSDPRAKVFWVRSAEDWMKVAAASEKLADRRKDPEAA
jgi:hypothetical protein